MDVSATTLSVLGIERPVEMLGNSMRPEASDAALVDRLDVLTAANDTAVSIDAAKRQVLNVFIVITVIVLVVATLFVVRQSYPRWLGALLRNALLLIVSLPVASYLMFAAQPRPASEKGAISVLASAVLITWVVALALSRGGRWVRPLTFICLSTAAVLAIDPWLGSPLSFTGFLSYSPLAGARYYGMGNEAAGLLFGSLLVGMGLLVDEHREGKWVRPLTRWAYPALGALVVWTAAAPGLGANVGVAAWGVVSVVVAWAAMNGWKPSWRMVAAIVLVVVVAVALLTAVDVATGGRTHLARAVESAQRGGLSELWLIVLRKVETNLRVLTHTNWAYVLVAVLGLFAYMRWKPRGDFTDALERFPMFSHALTASLLGGLVAYFTEDSGIVIPALMLLYSGVAVLYLMLSRERWGAGRE